MAKKGKGILNYLFDFFVLIFAALKWVMLSLWWLLTVLFSLLKKGVATAQQIQTTNKRPKQDALFDSLKEVESAYGNVGSFESQLYSQKSMIGLILGARGSGKSAIGMKLLENVYSKTGRTVYAMGFAEESLPTWIQPISSLDGVKNGSFILVDEGGIVFSSRSSMSSANKLLSDLLLISRHKDLSVLFITQNSANIEINTIRQGDYLILKPPSLLQLDFERKKIQDIYEDSKNGFEKYKDRTGLAYIYSHNYKGFITNALPSFWSTKLSKSFAHSASEEQKF